MAISHSSSYRIGIDARFFRSGTAGIGRYTRELLAELFALDQGNEYFVFLTEADMPEWQFDQPNVHPVVVRAPHYTFAEQTRFLAVLHRHKLDLVHFLNFNHPVLYRRPFVVTFHDLTLYRYPQGRSRRSALRRAAFLLILRRALKAAKRVIAISEHSAHDAATVLRISHAKIEVVYEGRPTPHEVGFGSKATIQQYLQSRQPYFLFVSQWRPHKGILTLIEAFTQFKAKTGLPHALVLAGNPKAQEAEVREALQQCPYTADILTPGFVPEELLPGLYHHATAFIMPSEYEGFGLPVLEAFTFGAPVIAAKNSSLPELVGNAGLLFPTRNAERLAEQMNWIAQSPDLAAELREKGKQQVKKFDWRKTAQQTLAVYQSVLEKQR